MDKPGLGSRCLIYNCTLDKWHMYHLLFLFDSLHIGKRSSYHPLMEHFDLSKYGMYRQLF